MVEGIRETEDERGSLRFMVGEDDGWMREVLRLTHDRKVIVSGDIYDAARGFWECVATVAPPGWFVEREDAS